MSSRILFVASCSSPSKPRSALRPQTNRIELLSTSTSAARLHTALDYESPYEAKLKEYEQRLAVIDKELLGKTEEVEELVDAETEELPSGKSLSAERESVESEERVPEEPVEDRFPTQVGVDDALGEAVEVPAKQAPRFKRRQSGGLER